jgi:hypothetical protein
MMLFAGLVLGIGLVAALAVLGRDVFVGYVVLRLLTPSSRRRR